MKEKKYRFREDLTAGHRPLILSDEPRRADELDLGGGAVLSGGEGQVIAHAKADFEAFLRDGLGIVRGNSPVPITLSVTKSGLGDAAAPGGRVITVGAGGITVLAYDERGAAQALYDLEIRMSERGGPFLKVQTTRDRPLFSPRMTHSAYDVDVYPDGYLQNLAREGYDAILVYMRGVDEDAMGKFDCNELIDRAESYGIDVYAYSLISNFHSPEAPDAEAVYDALYGSIFRAHPKLKGMVFVGESIEFPSRDPHTHGRQYFEYDNGPGGVPEGKPSPGWWPCEDYPVWIDLVKKSIRREKPDADVVFWTYNFCWAPKEARLALIDALPTDITLLVTFEVGQHYAVDGIDEHVSDYSLAVAGPCDCFTEEAAAAAKRGIRLYSMVNTGGRTWDFGCIPYEPFAQQWQRRLEAIRACRSEYGLCGLMESHHYGCTPSFLTRFVRSAYLSGTADLDLALRRAVDTFSGGETDRVLAALDLWSDSVRKLPANDEDQYCVMRISTAYPLILNHTLKIPRLDDEKVLNGFGIVYVDYRGFDKGNSTLHSMRIRPEIGILRELAETMLEGCRMLEEIENPTPGIKKLINLGKFIACTYRTNQHVKEMFLLRSRLAVAATREEIVALVGEIEKVAEAEAENAKESIPLVEADSALGFEPSMGYACDRAHIEWKLRQIDYMRNVELAAYTNALGIGKHKDVYL